MVRIVSISLAAASLAAMAVSTPGCATAVPAPPQHTHHAIDYIEITVLDMDAARNFYAAAFDWEFNDYGPEYSGIRKDVGEAGGLRLDTSIKRGGPLVILYSASLDQTFEQVKRAGAKITQDPFEFPGGRRFQFEDPSGNELAVWATD